MSFAYPKTKARYLKMNVVTSLNKVEVIYEAQKMIKKSATVMTDGKRCYRGLQDICKTHKEVIVKDKKRFQNYFHGRILLVMQKRSLALHHHIKDSYMQNYLTDYWLQHCQIPGMNLKPNYG